MTASPVHIAVEFLERLALDREAGRVGPLSRYLALFPGHEDLVAEEYLQVRLQERTEVGCRGGDDDGRRVGPYTLIEEIGRGGQAVVWKAHDPQLDRFVALKVVARSPGAPELSERFRREARATAGLSHPGICALHGAGSDQHCAWIAMRLVEGVSFDRWLRQARERRGTPGPAADGDELRTVLELVEAVGRALQVAHEQGVVHRDVKPANIMVQPDGSPVVLDFGVALLAEEGPQLTLSGTSLGTPAYMSPEQLDRERGAVGPASDVWSLGATLYEACTGQRAFPQPTREAVVQAILQGAPVDPRRLVPSLSRDLAAVIQTALRREPSGRYASTRDLADDLQAIREGRPTRARVLGPTARLLLWARRSPVVAGLSAALLVAAIVAGVWITRANVELSDANERLQRTNQELEDRTVEVDRESRAKAAALTELARASEATTAALTEYERMADAVRIRTAREQAEALYPVHPDLVPDLVAWQERHADLFARLPSHQQALEAMRARALPWTEAARQRDHAEALDLAARIEASLGGFTDEARPEYEARIEALRAGTHEQLSWDFGDDVDTQFRHDLLTELVRDLSELLIGEDSVAADVAERLALSRRVLAETVTDQAQAWAGARQRVAASPLYGGLELVEQVGLVPLGPDPDSGLEEFLIWETHPGEPPGRDGDGRLVLADDAGLVLVLLPPGTLLMGSQDDDPEGLHYHPETKWIEEPVHEVRLEAFLLGKHEVTQAQWERLTGQTPSGYLAGTNIVGSIVSPRNPVERVSWFDAAGALRRLGLVLPTEAQWEYGARGGQDQLFAGTSDAEALGAFANSAGREVRGHMLSLSELHEDRDVIHAPVGSYAANPFGLHDMTGNVWEWCRDRFTSYFAEPSGPEGERTSSSENRVYRGGAFHSLDADLRVSVRKEESPKLMFNGLGLRVARRLDPAD